MILPRLHLITDDRIALRDDFIETAATVARSGALALHLRASELGGRRLLALARQLRDALKDTRTLLFINDRVDLALAVGAHGVHLPERGMPLDAARSLLSAGTFLGRSAHSAEDARAAFAQGADYVFLGPIFETASHPGRSPLGLEAIRGSLPGRVIAIGGITPERAAQCIRAGAYGVAVIRAVWEAEDPGAAAEAILLSLESVEDDD
ncbi:MAG: putative thiamine-phosphate synthase 2 [Gemmatimonadales bacterium]|nr:Thiamine-phosphate synthase [bacterium HR33]GIW51897.1 MAG: putative thiamine-phosphate synthase 2 [Gemmatimonadales bacterium]